MREDASRIRCNPGIFARLRSLAYNILKASRIDTLNQDRYRAALGDLQPLLEMLAIRKRWTALSIRAAGSNSAARSTSLPASASPRAAEPNSDKRRMPARGSSPSCARSAAITVFARSGVVVVILSVDLSTARYRLKWP